MTSPAPEVSRLATRAFYDDEGEVRNYLAHQLLDGQLAMFLGSGATVGLGLPQWDDLIESAFARKSATRPEKLSNEDAAEYLLWDVCGGDADMFHEVLRQALYERIDATGLRAQLRQNPLLQALGSLFMPSRRGSIRNVVTFNFDDLLESFLREQAFYVEQVVRMPHWRSDPDVRVYHPHGLLPVSETAAAVDVVIAQVHFDRIVGNKNNAWRSTLSQILQSHTCLFVGLSGADQNLTNLLAEAHDAHPATARGDLFWAFRFSDNENDPRRSKWERRGVFQITLPGYEALPDWLRGVAHAAQELIVARRR